MDYKELLHKSKQEMSTADYMLTVTVPAIRDTNLLMSAFGHIDNSIILAITAFLAKQKENKKLRIFPSSEELRRQIFFEQFSSVVGITHDEKHILNELREIVDGHKKNQIEFKRGEDYVIVTHNFKTIDIKLGATIKYLSVARNLINKLEGQLK
jgi:hypothetical protein